MPTRCQSIHDFPSASQRCCSAAATAARRPARVIANTTRVITVAAQGCYPAPAGQPGGSARSTPLWGLSAAAAAVSLGYFAGELPAAHCEGTGDSEGAGGSEQGGGGGGEGGGGSSGATAAGGGGKDGTLTGMERWLQLAIYRIQYSHIGRYPATAEAQQLIGSLAGKYFCGNNVLSCTVSVPSPGQLCSICKIVQDGPEAIGAGGHAAATMHDAAAGLPSLPHPAPHDPLVQRVCQSSCGWHMR